MFSGGNKNFIQNKRENKIQFIHIIRQLDEYLLNEKKMR